MNIQARSTVGTILDDSPLSIADQIRLKITSISCELAYALSYAEQVTTSRHWPLEKAKEHLDFARSLYRKAVGLGATQAQLSQLAADGLTVAAAVASAEGRVREGFEAKAARSKRAEKEAALKGLRVPAAAGVIADALVAAGRFETRPDAMRALAMHVSRWVPISQATRAHLLDAWEFLA
jgi:hypothetical protein